MYSLYHRLGGGVLLYLYHIVSFSSLACLSRVYTDVHMLAQKESDIKSTVYYIYTLQLSPDCKYKATQVDFVLGREQFSWSGLTPVSPGYTEVYSWHAIESAESAARFEKGQSWDVHQVESCMKSIWSIIGSFDVSAAQVVGTPDHTPWLPHRE